MTWISKKEAVGQSVSAFPQLKLDEKTFLNWARDGRECQVVRQGIRIGFDSEALQAFHRKIEAGVVMLNRDDYLKCFKFGVESYYHNVTKSDFNRGKQRDVGEFLTNQVSGKLGEIAVQKLLLNQNLNVDLDFSVTGQVASQDITRVSTRRNVWNNPAIKASIKSTKLKNILLAIPEREANLTDRRSDVYILSLVGLFPNHILRLIKQYGEALLGESVQLVPDFEEVPVRVAGWATRERLLEHGPYTPVQINEEFGVTMSNPNYILRSGELSVDWETLRNILVGQV